MIDFSSYNALMFIISMVVGFYFGWHDNTFDSNIGKQIQRDFEKNPVEPGHWVDEDLCQKKKQ